MSFVQALILGIVEGVTEFLPISSTGHLILTSYLLGLSPTDFVKSFEIIIQLGAIGAIITLYWRSLFINWQVLKRIIVGFIPTAVLGLLFYKTIKTLLGSNTVVLWALFLGGIALILFEKWHFDKSNTSDSTYTTNAGQNDTSASVPAKGGQALQSQSAQSVSLSYKQAFLIGIFQAFAFIPGVSRAAATIIGGLALGLRRTAAVEFSFLLSVPTMLAAAALDISKNNAAFTPDQFSMLVVGFVAAFFVALAAVRFLLRFIKTHTFVPFGIYRIALAAVFFLILIG